MTLEAIPGVQGWGKPTTDYGKFEALFKELQGYKVTVVQGAAIDTDIAVAGIVTTDVLRHVLRFQGAVHALATVDTGVEANNNMIRWTSKVHGAAGNLMQVDLVDPGAPGQPLSITVSGAVITVNLATDGSSNITSTPMDIKTAIEGDSAANALVSVDDTPGTSDGTAAVVDDGPTNLAGGAGGLQGISDVVGEASITSDGNIQLTTTPTGADLLLLVWNDKSGG